MRNEINVLLVALFFGLFIIPSAMAGDTGTYQIQSYNVVLTPHYNGDIDISYSQKWLVTGGNIPWVTVGTPNSNYEIKDFGGAATQVEADNGGGWDGVKIVLDKDYQPQETFQFNFTIVQHGLFEKLDDGGYRLGFTPGWYDNAFTDALTVRVVSPAKIEELKIDPLADSTNGQDILWQRKLGRGEKFPVTVDFPNGTYNQTAMEQSTGGGGGIGFIVFIFVLAVVVFLIFIGGSDSSSSSGSSYSGSLESRRRRHGSDDDGYTHPVILVGGSPGSGGGSDHSSGGGGGMGGRSSSCVVSSCVCACACACAGGGGAGCTPKNRHSCAKCRQGQIEIKVKEDEQEK